MALRAHANLETRRRHISVPHRGARATGGHDAGVFGSVTCVSGMRVWAAQSATCERPPTRTGGIHWMLRAETDDPTPSQLLPAAEVCTPIAHASQGRPYTCEHRRQAIERMESMVRRGSRTRRLYSIRLVSQTKLPRVV